MPRSPVTDLATLRGPELQVRRPAGSDWGRQSSEGVDHIAPETGRMAVTITRDIDVVRVEPPPENGWTDPFEDLPVALVRNSSTVDVTAHPDPHGTSTSRQWHCHPATGKQILASRFSCRLPTGRATLSAEPRVRSGSNSPKSGRSKPAFRPGPRAGPGQLIPQKPAYPPEICSYPERSVYREVVLARYSRR